MVDLLQRATLHDHRMVRDLRDIESKVI